MSTNDGRTPGLLLKLFRRARRALFGRREWVQPRGMNALREIGAAFPFFQPRIVFDVGANDGQSTRTYLAQWPGATIHAFDPAPPMHDKLTDAFRNDGRVACHRLAIGATNGTSTMILDSTPTMSHMARAGEVAGSAATVDVQVVTLDAFCRERGITHIDYLKIDTEGGDLDALRGAAGLLGSNGVDFVEVEAGMHPGNTTHVPFESLKVLLEGHSYRLFGIYEQVAEWPTRAPHLRRTNPVFVSAPMIERARPAARGATSP